MSSMPYPQVVRVFATTQRPDYDSPWQTETARTGTGSGVVVGPRWILTGAHVVADATFLQVQETSSPDKVVARVVCVGHECDLALLTVDDDAFWANLPTAELDDLPELRDKVQVVGFPTGGEEISITEGVVSRLEVQRYSHSQRHLLAITVDAAINAGNSGGPVFRGDKVVGIAFQTLENAENVGELVPTVFIRRLLEAAEAGRDLLVPGLGLTTQGLENPTLRRSLGMADEESGVLVVAVSHESSSASALNPGDVLTHIDGLSIANNQTVRYRGQWRTHFAVVLADHHVGHQLPLRVLRNGEAIEMSLCLAPHVHLVPANRYDQRPRWFLYGGLVFQVLCRDYLETWNKWYSNAPRRFVELYYNGHRSAERPEIVVISQVLADAVNVGYEKMYNRTVEKVDGVVPTGLADLLARLDAAEGMVTLETDLNQKIVFDAAAVRAATPQLLARYRIPTDRA